MTSLFSETAREWRKQNIKPPRNRSVELSNELTQAMRRSFVSETLDIVPREVVAAQFALEAGDDGFAFLHLQRIVLAVREAARTFNEIRRGAKA